MINRKFFFEQCRATLFTGRLTQAQVSGMTLILDEWERAHAKKDDRWLAYALGTSFHETAFTMQPVREMGGDAYFFRMYDPKSPDPRRAALARKMGAQPGDGVIFHGRGFVQLTWRVNYQTMGRSFKVDLISSRAAADRAMQPALAARILFKGMEDGLFTGKRFADFFARDRDDWEGARKIINGVDQKEAIAVYAKRFYAAISYTTG
jgi:putative chitinase